MQHTGLKQGQQPLIKSKFNLVKIESAFSFIHVSVPPNVLKYPSIFLLMGQKQEHAGQSGMKFLAVLKDEYFCL